MKVLVLDANSKVALAACRSLGQAGFEVFSFGPAGSISHSSRFATPVRSERPGLNFDEVLRAVDLIQPTLLLPVSARAVAFTHANRSALDQKVMLILPEDRVLSLALDKAQTQAHATTIGIDVPAFEAADDYEDLMAKISSRRLPFVIKSNSHLSSSKTLYVESEFRRDEIIRRDLANPFLLHGSVQLQDRVQGHGEGFFALYNKGRLLNFMMHRRLREFPVSGGSSSAAESVDSEDLFVQGKKLLDSLDWSGPAMVEFKRTPSGNLSFVELNPKLWGSLDLTLASGVDIPANLGRLANAEVVSRTNDFEVGKVVWFPLDNLNSLIHPPLSKLRKTTTNVKFRDFGPTLPMLAQLIYLEIFERMWKGRLARIRHWMKEYGFFRAMLRIWNEILGIPTAADSRVLETLWVGAAPSLIGKFRLRMLGMTRFSLLAEENEDISKFWEKAHSFHLPEYVELRPVDLLSVVQDIEKIISLNQKVFLHCREGVGRAPSVAIAYLIWSGLSIEEASKQVSKGRSITKLSGMQSESIEKFAVLAQKFRTANVESKTDEA